MSCSYYYMCFKARQGQCSATHPRRKDPKRCPEYAGLEAEARADAEAEQAFERRAAFGPGVEVVNILTGRRYRT